MTLAGTRPPTVDEWDKYELHHRARLATKPGLTGMWQVSGRSNITDFEEVVKLDKQYISEWTMGLDIIPSRKILGGMIMNILMIYPKPDKFKKPRFGFSYEMLIISTVLSKYHNVSIKDFSCEHFDMHNFMGYVSGEHFDLALVECDSYALKRSQNVLHAAEIIDVLNKYIPTIAYNAHVLAPKNIIEKLVLEIPVNISQMSALTCGRTCKKVGIDRNRLSQQGIVLVCGQECKDNGNQERNCNFLCKWFCVKNENLIKELAALKEYLNRNKNNYFKSAIEIRIKCNDRTSLDARQFEILNEYIGKM